MISSPKKVIVEDSSANENIFNENNQEFRALKEELDKMKSRITDLEMEVVFLKSKQSISEIVNDRLRNDLNSLEAYSRRSCVIIDGLPPACSATPSAVEAKVKTLMKNAGHSVETIGDIDKLIVWGR